MSTPSNNVKSRPRDRGFSLVEVIIGAMALIFIIIPALMTVSQTTRIMDKARDVTLASSVGQSLMEQMRMQTYAGVCSKYCGLATPVVGTTYPYSEASFQTDIQNEKFTAPSVKNYHVTGNFTCVATGQLNVELTIAWTDLNKVAQSHKIFTIISEGGLSDNVNKGW